MLGGIVIANYISGTTDSEMSIHMLIHLLALSKRKLSSLPGPWGTPAVKCLQ